MKYKIRSDQFCALSRDPQWQSWLSNIASDLGDMLKAHLKKSKGCRSNREVMQIIRKKLDDRGFSVQLVQFLKKIFPIALGIVSEKNEKVQKGTNGTLRKIAEMNKHEVFRSYKPHILTFPHKYIIINDDPNKLMNKTKRFIKTKIYPNYIIIEDRAYIEYFEPRYKEEAMKVDHETSDISRYKRKLKLSQK